MTDVLFQPFLVRWLLYRCAISIIRIAKRCIADLYLRDGDKDAMAKTKYAKFVASFLHVQEKLILGKL